MTPEHIRKRVNIDIKVRYFQDDRSALKGITLPESFYNKSCFETTRIILSLTDLTRYIFDWSVNIYYRS